MFFALFLHLYQPSTQYPQVLKKICRTSYLPLLQIIDKAPRARVTVNLTGALTQLLAEGKAGSLGKQVLALIAKTVRAGKVELTGSAAYHPLLPSLPVEEIKRQIELNQQINQSVLGSEIYPPLADAPRGFFPPELFYTSKVGKAVEELGFEYLLLDESAHPQAKVVADELQEHEVLKLGETLYQLKSRNLKVFFRHREASLRIAFADELSLNDFFSSDQLPVTSYQLLALDGETFGYHRPKLLGFLEELMRLSGDSGNIPNPRVRFSETRVGSEDSSPETFLGRALARRAVDFDKFQPQDKARLRKVSEKGTLRVGGLGEPFAQVPLRRPRDPRLVTVLKLLAMNYPVEEIEPRESSWGSIYEDITGRRSFPRWDNPQNPLHRLQWQLFNLALITVNNKETPYYSPRARGKLDQGLQSDQFWWASANPCWHPGMVERGAVLLRDAVLMSEVNKGQKQQAQRFYEQIVKKGRQLFGEEVVEC